jgi:hypothetical protein
VKKSLVLTALKEQYQKASNALNQLGNTASIRSKQFSNQIIKIFTQFEEIRYKSETIPDSVIHSDKEKSNLKDSGEIRVARLLSEIICNKIADDSLRLSESLEFGEEDLDIRSEIVDIHKQVKRLGEIVQIQQKLADGAPISTEALNNLQKKYETRIRQLEKEILRKEGRSLTITALDSTEKPKLFGKGKFFDNLANLVLEYGKNLRASSGGYITLANLYTSLKDQVPDINFSVKDLEKACNRLAKQSLIEGVSKSSGIKIVEFVPVSLGKDAQKIFNLAVNKGFVSFEEVVLHTKWDQQRATRVLESLVSQKIARKVSSLDSGDQYYFPGLYGEDDW